MGSTEAHLLRLYDAYLEQVIHGDAVSPERFLHAAGVSNVELRDRLEQLYRIETAGVASTATGARPVVAGQDSGSRKAGLEFEARTLETTGLPMRLGEFVLRERLGEGGMGVVYLAEQPSVGRVVAVKVIRPEFARSASAAARFDREARAIARLRHPNIVTVHAVGDDRGIRYLAMEYVEGATLSELLAATQDKSTSQEVNKPRGHQGKRGDVDLLTCRSVDLSLPTIVRWTAQLARALQYAHENNIVHRDVKPSNIRITPDGGPGGVWGAGRPLLLDFGLARDLSSEAATLTEGFIGSPQYVAPEQIGRGSSTADGRADVYSLGVVLYECITGAAPFAGESLEQVLHSILTYDPPPPRALKPGGRAIPRDLSVIVMKAIEKDPKQRYATAGELADDLEALMEFRPIRARPPGMVQRGWKWCRRHPAASTGGVVIAFAALALASILAVQHLGEQRQRRTEASSALARAAALVEQYREGRAETEQLEAQYESLRRNQAARYFTPAEDRLLADAENDVVRARNQREQAFHEVQALLERSERLGAADDDVRRILADLYFARYLDAVLVNDSLEQSIYLELVRRHDPNGRLDAELRGAASVQIVSDPPGAEVFLFRLVEGGPQSQATAIGVPASERRVVPMPWRGWPAALDSTSPGEWALRVVRGANDIQPGDLILELAERPIRGSVFVTECPASGAVQRFDRLAAIDGSSVQDEYDAQRLGRPADDGRPREFTFERNGQRFVVHGESLAALNIHAAGPRTAAEIGGVKARVWAARDGVVSAVELPAGVSVRVTAAPAFIGPDAFLGRTPLNDVHLEGGVYLVVLRHDGYEDMRHPLHILRGSPAELSIQLAPSGSTGDGWGDGWVRVPIWSHASPLGQQRSMISRDSTCFWIMEREVTMREYFEFLNDPETLAEIGAASPDDGSGGPPIRVPRVGGVAPPQRDPGSGRFVLPEDWSWEWPAFGVSWHDAQAFAEWKTKQARAAGRDETYALPTLDEWSYAAGHTNYRYVFGSRFHPKWVSSCFSRPGPPIPGALGPKPEPPMSFPIDESIFGVYDTAGSVSEWIDDWWLEDSGMRRYAGGSWAHADPEEQFAIYGGNGARPEARSGTIGFRLVMRRPARENAVE